jgi:hypothetical protein
MAAAHFDPCSFCPTFLGAGNQRTKDQDLMVRFKVRIRIMVGTWTVVNGWVVC